MPSRSSRRTNDTRAEARRRARQLAEGRADEEELEEEGEAPARPTATPPGSTFLTRLFPPAPPLPGKPDPLAGFGYTGPMRGLVSGLYILGRNPVPWLAFAAAWAVGRLLTTMSGGGIAEVAATIITFLALLAAGWFGWQRPWLFGLAAAVAGTLIFAFILAILLANAPGSPASALQWFVGLTARDTFQWLFGVLAGWYGGYLRRRMIATAPARPARRR